MFPIPLFMYPVPDVGIDAFSNLMWACALIGAPSISLLASASGIVMKG